MRRTSGIPDPNQLIAREAASTPRTARGRALARIRQVAFGRPLSNEAEIDERLPKKKALAIFSSDPISSSAYATEEILRVLVLAGTGFLFLSLPIAAAIALLLAVVSTSYRQIGHAYPSGGGAYAVARANLPSLAALVAAGALLVDYVMTVAVSTASAVEQIISAVPQVADERLLIGVAAIALITLGNLRGLRESGNIFAIPTYLFVGSALLMIGIGVFRIVVLGESAAPPSPLPGAPDPLEPLGLLLIIRAFASGSVALTGTEAIANGVPAFKPPESRNAAATLTIVAVLLAVLFLGITFVALNFGIVAIDEPAPKTVISQVAALAFGDGSIGFYLFQAFTALILFLAANTSYNAFPRLAAILARDGYLPRQFSFRGDRLAFTSGIVILSLVAIALLIIFEGNTTALIPLYSVGVFVSFTISQGGMVRHWLRERSSGWRWRLAVNGFGLRADRVRRRRRDSGEGTRVAARGDRDPDPRRGNALHQRPVPSIQAAARRRSGARRAGAAPGGTRDRPRSTAWTGRRSRQSTSVARSRTTCGRSTSPTIPRTPPASGRRSSARFPACRSSSSTRRTVPSPGRFWRTSTCSMRRGRRASLTRSCSS